MKKKLGLACFFVMVTVGSMFLFSFTDGDETATRRWDTGICRQVDTAGAVHIGSGCFYPNQNGPCTRETDCH